MQGTSGAAACIWEFARALYGQPGVAGLCLAAQDEHGCDVNLLIFALWAGREGQLLDESSFTRAQVHCQDWREAVVLPLRAQRIRWKHAAHRNEEYAAIKTLELEAERFQLEMLARRLPALRSGAADTAELSPAHNLRAVLALYRLSGGVQTQFEVPLLAALDNVSPR